MVNIMSSDCEDLPLSLSEAMLYPKQAHLFSFELFLVIKFIHLFNQHSKVPSTKRAKSKTEL